MNFPLIYFRIIFYITKLCKYCVNVFDLLVSGGAIVILIYNHVNIWL